MNAWIAPASVSNRVRRKSYCSRGCCMCVGSAVSRLKASGFSGSSSRYVRSCSTSGATRAGSAYGARPISLYSCSCGVIPIRWVMRA